MPLPKLSDAQIAWTIHQVAKYIEAQRQTFRHGAANLNKNQMAAMRAFFSAPTVDLTRVVVLADELLRNPSFYRQLVRMGFEPALLPDFKLMNAITFVDTVVSHAPFSERLLLHELVHVVQYEKLGLPEFAAKYVRGFLSGGSLRGNPTGKKCV